MTPICPVCDFRVVVKAEDVIWFRPARVETVFQQRARAADRFFRRLSDENDRAVPFVFQLRKRARHADEGRHVNVVPAGVHDLTSWPASFFVVTVLA